MFLFSVGRDYCLTNWEGCPTAWCFRHNFSPCWKCEFNDSSDERLWGLLPLLLSSVEKYYCVVDALDEMELIEKDGFFFVWLNGLATCRPDWVKLFMTDQPKHIFQSCLGEAPMSNQLARWSRWKGYCAFCLASAEVGPARQQEFKSPRLTRFDNMHKISQLFFAASLVLDQIAPILQPEKQVDIESLAESLPIGPEGVFSKPRPSTSIPRYIFFYESVHPTHFVTSG